MADIIVILFLLFFALPLLLRYLARARGRSPLDILLTMSNRRQPWTHDWPQGAASEPEDRIICPACGATNFTSESACWQCQRPLTRFRRTTRVAQSLQASTTSFQIRQVTYDGRTAIQFSDGRGRRHIFPSWDQAPPAVLQEIEKLPEPMRSNPKAEIARQAQSAVSPSPRPPLLAGQGPPRPNAPQPEPAAQQPPATPQPQQAAPEADQKQQQPSEEQAPWLEL